MKRMLVFLFLFFNSLDAQAQEPSDLETSARAVIQKRCLPCHNEQLKTADLIFATREAAVKGGKSGPALVPNRPDESLMMRKILDGKMPPGDPLPSQEREIVRKWVEAGAPWADASSKSGVTPQPRAGLDWWSLQPLRNDPEPDPKGLPREWSASPIDRFIYAKLQEKGLQPNSPADRRTYIRRATFDLLGLPPSPEEVKAFVEDKSPNAYEKLIDRLLASPHYGERWGRHWLDVIRFGESTGYEQNHLRDRAWPFRDYMIRSFNEDKPFTQMVLEQLAGDQIAPNSPDVEVATGFLVAGTHDNVSTKILEEKLVQRAADLDDMVLATGNAFLGLTVQCARCHDHKYDPIPQADYYRMQSVFAGVQHGERELATLKEKERHKAQEKPILEELEQIKQRMAALKTQAQPRVEQRRDAITKHYRPAIDAKGNEETFPAVSARFVRMTILATMKNKEPALDELEVWRDRPNPVNVALASHGTRATVQSSKHATGMESSLYKQEFVNDGKFDAIWISGQAGTGEVTLQFPKIEVISRITWSRDRLNVTGEDLDRVPTQYVFETSLDGTRWEKVTDSEDRLPYAEEDREEFFLLAAFSTEEQGEWQSLKQRRTQLQKDLDALPKLPVAYIGSFAEPKGPTYLLKRGKVLDRGDVISTANLSALQKTLPGFQLDANAPEGKRRMALAQWIIDNRNPLTARVLANRIWHYHFGKGLVGTPSDFGFNGERPTHPELLDWLAHRLQSLGWRLKPLHKELMLSATYRQSSADNPSLHSVDGDSRYLWRFPPKRLEAEAVRDTVLAVSGKLNRQLGGPGFRLYKYAVDNVAAYDYRESFDEQTYRRAVYQQSARSVRDDLLGLFDCPDSALPEPKRVVTTTALQALSLLNNPFMLDQARFFAERVARESGKDGISTEVERAFQLALNRSPKKPELAAALDLIKKHGLIVFCRVLLNANEFIYVM
ncbi:MAG: DUF1553 domain-containing protein [Acidobacteria bacterium]|nr:DUF1553 domain-containing protein [Acidobacteriota bacterium]MCI0722278.1 DUF1553 domain-containing protein [Acidobacteriota bacterium]